MGVGSMVSTSHSHAPTHVGDMAECMYVCSMYVDTYVETWE